MYKSQFITSSHRVISKKRVDTCGAPVFAPGYSATVLVAEMCTNHSEHSI